MQQPSLAFAINTVAADVRESHPDLSKPMAIQHALDTVSADTLDEDNETAASYRVVLTADAGEVALCLSELVSGQRLDENDVWQSTDGRSATIDGVDALEWLNAVYCLD